VDYNYHDTAFPEKQDDPSEKKQMLTAQKSMQVEMKLGLQFSMAAYFTFEIQRP